MKISPCITINIDGPHSREIVRRCTEEVITSQFHGRSRTADRLLEWIDTTQIATVEEASETFILRHAQHLLTLASDKEAACHAALITLPTERTILMTSVDPRFADNRDLAQLTGHFARHYAEITEKRSVLALQACPQTVLGASVVMPTLTTSNGGNSNNPTFVERLVTVCCMISWLLTGFDRVEIDLDAAFAGLPNGLSGAMLPVAFDMSGDLTVGKAVSRVRDVLREYRLSPNSLRQRNHHRHRSKSRPSILGYRGPREALRVDDLTISTLSLTFIGPWDARVTILEERQENVVVLTECDWLGDVTFGDLTAHIDSCIRNAPHALASRVFLQHTRNCSMVSQ